MTVTNMENKRLYTLLLIFILLFVNGCSSGGSKNRLMTEEKKEGNFCDRLRYIIIAGSEYFDSLKGSLNSFEMAEGAVTLPNSIGCAIDVGDSFETKYICYFGDGDETKLPKLKASARQLERDVHNCIADGNPFRYNDGERYRNYGVVGGDGFDDEFWIWFKDRQYDQDVSIFLDNSGSRYSLTLEVESY